jgi:hypothetical protein
MSKEILLPTEALPTNLTLNALGIFAEFFDRDYQFLLTFGSSYDGGGDVGQIQFDFKSIIHFPNTRLDRLDLIADRQSNINGCGG